MFTSSLAFTDALTAIRRLKLGLLNFTRYVKTFCSDFASSATEFALDTGLGFSDTDI